MYYVVRNSPMQPNVHLHVVIHGMSGTPQHMSELVRHFVQHEDTPTPDMLEILIIESNAGDCAYDGIDWCAERALLEVRGVFEHVDTSLESAISS